MSLYVSSHYKVIVNIVRKLLAEQKPLSSHKSRLIGPDSNLKKMTAWFKRGLLLFQNSPNDLQMLSDAPAHQIFCLLGPVDPASTALPEVLCVLQVTSGSSRVALI